jgi:predicted metal-dependent phosphoesterase TrpH
MKREGDYVRFERPHPGRILAEGYHPADMHFHTAHTDGTVGVRSLLDRIRQTGVGCAVTDHNEISGALEACTAREDLLVIPGIEISTFDGPHILVYFYTPRDLEDYFQKYIGPNRRESPWMLMTLTSEEVLEAAEGYSCLRCAAHPYGYFMFNSGLAKCIEKGFIDASVYGDCDMVEGICANMSHSENLRAISLASRLGLPISGGSDGHIMYDLGTAVTCTRSSEPGEFLDELRKMRAIVVGREKNPLSKIITGAAISARFVPWFYPSVKIHYERTMMRLNRAISKRR